MARKVQRGYQLLRKVYFLRLVLQPRRGRTVLTAFPDKAAVVVVGARLPAFRSASVRPGAPAGWVAAVEAEAGAAAVAAQASLCCLGPVASPWTRASLSQLPAEPEGRAVAAVQVEASEWARLVGQESPESVRVGMAREGALGVRVDPGPAVPEGRAMHLSTMALLRQKLAPRS
jgi:hypothetical protein